MSQKELLRVEHLKKYFQTPRGTLSAVEDVSFRIEERQTLGVVGESGCGKSTLGRCILRLHEPTGGKVIFNGENILEYDKVRLKRLRSDKPVFLQHCYIFAHGVLTHAYRFPDVPVAGPALMGLPILQILQITVDCQLSMRQSQQKDFIREREEM